ncbi:hypothetical protein HYE68_007412 [Fusarium pseudograminearum]|nr:hypothetical protein HYE68_007412 [Fusarium pseudograminearum]
MKAVTSLVLHCAAVTVAAAALPDGSQVVSDPLAGYEIVPMQWKGVIKEGEAPVSLNGTIESVISQIKELNPEFELVEEDPAESSGLEARNPSNIICNVGGTGYVDVKAAQLYAVWMAVLASALASPVLMAMLSGFATTTATTSNPGAATWLTMWIALLQAASRKPAARLVQSGLALLVGPHGSFGASSSILTDTTLLLAEATASLLIGCIMVA